MEFFAWIGLIAFIAYVAKAGYDVVAGGADWIGGLADDAGSMWDDDDWLNSNDDIITSPIYSYMSCNIWHDPFADDFSFSSSSSDDDWGWDDE